VATKDALPDEPHPREPDEIDAERQEQSEEEKLELAPQFPAAIGAPDHTPHHAPLHWWGAWALSTLSGVLYWAAFPGIDVWPFAFVCWAPLLVAIRGQTPRRALWLGAWQGLTCNVLGFYWLLTMLQTFSGFPIYLCALFMLILCAYQGGRMGLMTWLYARAERKGWPAGLVFTLAFVASEMIYPLLFPWYTGAQTHKMPLLMQLAELGGPIAIGVALAGGSMAVAEVAWSKLDKRAIDRRRMALALSGPAFMIAFGAIRIPMVKKMMEGAEKGTVGVVQGNMPLGGGLNAIEVHRAGTLKIEQEHHPDLVVWSEAAIPSSIPDADLGRVLQSYVMYGIHTPTVVGLVVQRGGDRVARVRGNYFNSAALIEPNGQVTGVYDKTYLLAFGEYIPFGDWFPSLYEISKNSGRLTKGSSLESIPFRDHKITTLICYEDILPSFVNGAVRKGDPDLLVNMTNDAWFGKSTEPGIHLALAKYRAIEHRRYLVRATNTGVSAWVDPLGRSSGETPLFEQTNTVGEIRWMRSRTVYEVLGDKPWWLCTLAIIALGFLRRGDDGKVRFELRHSKEARA
jgi:apolipoprotein N-acyltransferase